MKFKLILFTVILSISTLGKCCIKLPGDTIFLSKDKIQNVEITCNTVSIQPKTEVINTQAAFNKFIGNSCHSTPSIDFATQTLLYFPTKIMGYHPDYVRTVKISGKQVIYQVNIISYNGTPMLLYNSNCIAIPKIDSGSTVHFQKIETTK